MVRGGEEKAGGLWVPGAGLTCLYHWKYSLMSPHVPLPIPIFWYLHFACGPSSSRGWSVDTYCLGKGWHTRKRKTKTFSWPLSCKKPNGWCEFQKSQITVFCLAHTLGFVCLYCCWVVLCVCIFKNRIHLNAFRWQVVSGSWQSDLVHL